MESPLAKPYASIYVIQEVQKRIWYCGTCCKYVIGDCEECGTIMHCGECQKCTNCKRRWSPVNDNF